MVIISFGWICLTSLRLFGVLYCSNLLIIIIIALPSHCWEEASQRFCTFFINNSIIPYPSVAARLQSKQKKRSFNSKITCIAKIIKSWRTNKGEPSLTRSSSRAGPGESPRDKGRSPKDGGWKGSRHLAEGGTTRWKSPGYNIRPFLTKRQGSCLGATGRTRCWGHTHMTKMRQKTKIQAHRKLDSNVLTIGPGHRTSLVSSWTSFRSFRVMSWQSGAASACPSCRRGPWPCFSWH